MDGETIFLIGVAVFLLARAIWLSLAKGRHLAWMSALAVPLVVLGWLTNADWVLLAAVALFMLGEFLYQTNDEISPGRFEEIRGDLQTDRRRWRRRNRTASDARPRHSSEDSDEGQA